MAARLRLRPDLGEGEQWPWARPGSGASLPRATNGGLVDCVVVKGGIGGLCIAARSPFFGTAFAESESGARFESA
ncbi:hypothetical protein NL676_003405 [Syzygium grande]|nr:hypothetical protein NL676_003405 [Syzygium grande]